MSELKAYNVVVTDECADYICGQEQLSFEAYEAEDVDAYIARLKAENDEIRLHWEEIEQTRAENERLVKCCKEYDSRQRIDERIKFNGAQQLRATKRALWLVRAKRNRDLRTLGNFRKYAESLTKTKFSRYHYPTKGFPCTEIHNRMMDSFDTWCKYLKIAEDKCLKKAEEYK